MDDFQSVSRTRSYRQKRRNKRTKRSLLSLSLLVVFLVCASVFGYGYWKLDQVFNGISETPGNKANAATHDPDPVSLQTELPVEGKMDKPFAVAIFGTDTRDGSGGTLNTDVVMVALIDPEQQNVRLLSIPRDTKVEIPGYSGYHKINAAYSLGDAKQSSQERRGEAVTESGPMLLKKALSRLLDIPVDYHVHIGFDGFIEVVDAVNGVKVNVQRSMEYDDDIDSTHIRIGAGEQVLDGKNALDYVRHRLDNRGPNFYSSDFERNARQQEVMGAILDKLISFDGIANINKVLNAITSNVSTNFTPDQMKDLAWKFSSLRNSQIISVENEAYWDSGQAYTIIPETRLNQIRQEFQGLINGPDNE